MSLTDANYVPNSRFALNFIFVHLSDRKLVFLAQKVMSGGSDTNRHHLSQGCDFWCGFARLSIVHIYAQLSQKHFKATFKIFSYFNFLGVTSKKNTLYRIKSS